MHSIRQKLLFFLVLPFVILGVMQFIGTDLYIKRVFISRLEQESILASSRIAGRIRDGVLADDRIGLTQTIFDERYAAELISYITVFGSTGAVLAHTSLDDIPPAIYLDPSTIKSATAYISYRGANLFTVDTPLFSGLYPVGMIRIGFDYGAIAKTFDYTLYLFLVAGGVILTAVSFAVFRISNSIAQPISELTSVTSEFGQGRFTQRARITSGDDEIAKLSRSFNAMADSLQEYRGSLGHEKTHLEKKIRELEQWQQATIGRELKMVELKETLEKHQQEEHGEELKKDA